LLLGAEEARDHAETSARPLGSSQVRLHHFVSVHKGGNMAAMSPIGSQLNYSATIAMAAFGGRPVVAWKKVFVT